MSNKIIIMRCPKCGSYLEQRIDKVWRCPRCWTAVWETNKPGSPWERAREANQQPKEEFRIGEVPNPGIHGGGGSKSKRKRKKPTRMIRQLYGYDT